MLPLKNITAVMCPDGFVDFGPFFAEVCGSNSGPNPTSFEFTATTPAL
jgi:hypothetical protein